MAPIPPHRDPPQPTGDPEGDALASAIGALHASREGVLAFDDEHIAVRFVTCAETGRIVIAVPVAAAESSHGVVHIPREGDDALQLLLNFTPVQDCAATDRWRIFHGDPDHPRWILGDIESARYGPWVFEGEELTQPNILIHAEPALVRELNADPARLVALCRSTGLDVEAPRAVGVHHHGIHVRVRYGVVHIPFPQNATDADHARRIIRHMLERGARN